MDSERRIEPHDTAYRLDWSRPVTPHLPGERSYHATNGTHHLLVIVTHDQLMAAERLAAAQRADDPDRNVQTVIEDAIERAIATRPLRGGELRMLDEDLT